jgi:RimJ/RimL family protein N-acetyltransferase
LRSGLKVIIRPITPSDAKKLSDFHETLSDRTIYMRHFAAHPHLSDAELTRFTNVDHIKREAYVALDGDAIVGVGRWDSIDEKSAEVAFVISDQFQHQGLGSVLFSLLAQAATEYGIQEFVAEVLPQNRAMMRLFEVFGESFERKFEDGVVTMTVKLSPPS